MELNFSFIIPVYNRPKELDELLQSIVHLDYTKPFEVVVVEDGSQLKSDAIIDKFRSKLNLQYFCKENSGPGLTRNFGIEKATGNYMIILDSDVILPEGYLSVIANRLQENFTHAFGGPDSAHSSFTVLQKAINYSMTSFLTTGGIRGKKNGVGKFQLRSFNLGISKEAFLKISGFSEMRAGEDIDLTFRLWEEGYTTQLISEAFVYHKRRNTLPSFYKQTFSFGTARPKLNKKYPSTAKPTFWFPTLFILGFDLAILLLIFWNPILAILYAIYFVIIVVDSSIRNKSLAVGLLSIITTFTQFMGYGLGFLESKILLKN